MTILRHHGVEPAIDATAFIAHGACLIGDVTVGQDSSIWFNAVLRGDINGITVGRRANVQDGVVVHVTREYPVLIDDEVTVGHQAVLHGCRVLQRSLIGMNAIVLDNAVIGPSSIVAAGAVVREHAVVPEGVLVAGVPARVVRPLTEKERAMLAQSAENYVQYARSYREP
jgi:carbonic anhydrase/acetyltransferase-like protein (isoleucine patch superfamily)